MDKRFWYAFVFVTGESGATTYASVYRGLANNFVSLKEIKDARTGAGVKQDAVLLSANYLGYGSYEEFMADE